MNPNNDPVSGPFRRVNRIPGPTSWVTGRVFLLLLCLWIVGAVVLIGLLIAHVTATKAGGKFFLSFMFAWLGVGVLMFATLGIGYLQIRHELRRGDYTVQDIENAVQIEPRTGVVIREAGDPLLSPAEYKARVREARAWAKANPR